MIPGVNVPFLVFAIVALNLTMFAVALQLDLLIIDSTLSKVVSWTCAVGCWHMAWKFRNYPQMDGHAKRPKSRGTARKHDFRKK